MTVLAAGSSAAAWVQPGVLGFLVVFGMAVVLYFVFRSMSRHLRKVNAAARAEAEQRDEGQREKALQNGTVTSSSGDRPAGDRS